MAPRQKAKLAFASALVLLLASGLAAAIAIVRLSRSAGSVTHTYEVQIAARQVESILTDAARARFSFVNSGHDIDLQQYESDLREIPRDLKRIRDLTRDNPIEQKQCTRLENLAQQRIEILQASVDLYKSGHNDDEKQDSFTTQNLPSAYDISSVVDQMNGEEQRLLAQRRELSASLYALVLAILGALVVFAACLFVVQYMLLNHELKEREQAEASARRLSARVLHMQDEERRKFSREMHDSLGQSLSVAKMITSSLLRKNPNDSELSGLATALDQCLLETRTISYLLHPPLLDEMGFVSAAKWYVDGFAQRSGLAVSVDIADGIGRMPHQIELVLFRVLQESLINIHRHAKSSKADISVHSPADGVTLRIRDYGQGIPALTLEQIKSNGTQFGVGLVGIQERVRENGGRLEIHSDSTGTLITVTLPRILRPSAEREPVGSIHTV